jgi:hypothetical protein
MNNTSYNYVDPTLLLNQEREEKIKKQNRLADIKLSMQRAKKRCRLCNGRGDYQDPVTKDWWHKGCYAKIKKIAPGESAIKDKYQRSLFRSYPPLLFGKGTNTKEK